MTKDEIKFVGKYKKWFCAKSTSITPKSQDPEVVNTLLSISYSIEQKQYNLLGVDLSKVNEFVKKITKGKKKRYKNLGEFLSTLTPKQVKEGLKPACKKEGALPFAIIAFHKRLFDAMGCETRIEYNRLKKNFPDLNFQKPKGKFL